ncbi:hypothetical protein [Tissierella sp.]|uniref:hypothetical protein n=1 Tax=Tissierella sp. TaxID=41274 RepID=UPI0028A65111|nr:hypothetical protein [Tissierella sp.]
MKKVVACLIMTILILSINISLVNASYIEKGNPTATYADRIILPNGNEVDLNEYSTLLF